MPRKKKPEGETSKKPVTGIIGLQARVLEQPITDTLEANYMPYAMSVIVSRAIPEIDGFKPSQRKLLYTMYKMNLLTGARTKSANIVGQTMRLNPHGDSAIYETMVRMSKGYEALLIPFVDSKGSFGKVYSRDMAYAASRYTEAKLSPVCSELLRDIDKDTVDFQDNYDGSVKEPVLLPTTYPNVLVSANTGIAVGMASQICGFNLVEVCEAACEYIKDPDCDLMSILKAPDFPTGAELIYDRDQLKAIYETGRGSIKLRAKWRFDSKNNLIEIYEIPYTTTAEAIIDKVAELIKLGKVREINDMRDETDLSGLKLAIELKRGTDPEKLMGKLMKMTPLMDTFSCNFNILIAGMPRVMGIAEILEEWIAWRTESIRRRVWFDIQKKSEKLHLLKGLERILMDIDKAIAIIRNTESEAEVVPNLMIGFGIDEQQAEYVAEIKLRNINREYILKRIDEVSRLEEEIADLKDIAASRARVRRIITDELKSVAKKYGSPRKTDIIYDSAASDIPLEEEPEDYPVTLLLTKQGYFKKMTQNSLRMNSEQKYKEDDGPRQIFEGKNRTELLVFTDKCRVYKTRASDHDDTKASALGSYLPSVLQMDEGESVICMYPAGEYKSSLIFFYENGKAARVPISVYATKTNRRKLTGAYSDKSPVRSILLVEKEFEVAVYSTEGRVAVFSTALLAPKATRDSQGVFVMTLKAKFTLDRAVPLSDTSITNYSRYRVRKLPASGAMIKPEDSEMRQLSIL
ncbi:MAG: topoisomerase IV [Clostridiales bacterium]|nr:topoisomerase IV [Clostridiales bacterium]